MENLKQISVRMPKEYWVFLRGRSTMQERSINDIMLEYIRRAMKKSENKVDTE